MFGHREGCALFLKNYTEDIGFLGNPVAQEEAWLRKKTHDYSDMICLFLHGYDLLINDKDNYKIVRSDLNKLTLLYNMVSDFSLVHPSPSSIAQYRELLYNNQWRKIQSAAKELYDSLTRVR